MRLEDLRAELEQRANAAYLLTVGDDGRPHCLAVVVEWRTGELAMGAGRTSMRNAASRGTVTLLSPPPSAHRDSATPDDTGTDSGRGLAGYSLIVDCDLSSAGTADLEPGVVRVRPTHAVLHRPAVASNGARGHDCVHVYDEGL